MSNQVLQKISEASNVSKNQIVDKIKSEYSVRYDQMIVNGDIQRNDVLYINYRAKYINVATQKVIFALAPDVAYEFESNYTGGEGAHGAVGVLEQSMIKSIKDSNALIAEKSIQIEQLDHFYVSEGQTLDGIIHHLSCDATIIKSKKKMEDVHIKILPCLLIL